jgi:hypothetical protein
MKSGVTFSFRRLKDTKSVFVRWQNVESPVRTGALLPRRPITHEITGRV